MGSQVSNVRVGNEAWYGSLESQRNANRTIKVTKTVPAGAEVIGPIEAARGHRDWRYSAPTEETVLTDLKVIAYTKGADGIADVKFSKSTNLMENFWYVLEGRATAYRDAQVRR